MDNTGYDINRVLVIDDDPPCARAVCALIRRAGAQEPTWAASGDEAVAVLRRQPFDLILCDLHMPGTDGVELLRTLADTDITCPIALVSGAGPKLLGTAAQAGRSRGLNMLTPLQKPFSLADLRERMQEAQPTTRPRLRRPVEAASAQELSVALEQEQLLLHYQPQLSLTTGALEGVEALVRWNHPTRGLIFPDAFVGTAEESGLIEPLTDWVLRAAIARAARWHREGLRIGVSINLSARSLSRLDLPDRAEQAARVRNLDPTYVTLEVTESGVSDDVGSMLDIVTRMRIKGFPLSIDDFGTGFSSLAQLRRLPFTELKLDRSFVQGAAAVNDADALSVLESSVNLAKRLRLKTVAEGIETRAEWNMLRSLGVDLGQGYYMARPMAADALAGWHAQWQRQVSERDSLLASSA